MVNAGFARFSIRFATMLVALMALAGGATGQVIRLRDQITVEPRQDVRLGDLAAVTGTDRRTAEELAGTVILSGVESSRKLGAESILLALLSQRGAAALASLQVSGAAECQINVAGAAVPGRNLTPVAAPAARLETPPAVALSSKPVAATTPAAAGAASGQTLSQIIADRIIKDSGIPGADLHINFETISPNLERTLPPNQKWICRPLTRTFLGTVQFEAQLVEGARVAEKTMVSVRVERRIKAVIALGSISRGELAAASKIRTEDAWVDRALPMLFTDGREVAGLEAQRDIAVGSMLDQRDFKPALMTSKNDPVTVIYLSGALKVQIRGRALEQGKLHDQIEVRNETTGERYQAVLIGRHLAVVGGTLNEAEEKRLREAQ